MQWNEVDYEYQIWVMDLLEDCKHRIKDPNLHEIIDAAVYELNMWSDCPVEFISDDSGMYISEAYFIDVEDN